MLNPPYGERIEVGGQGGRRGRDVGRDAIDAERLLRPPGGALEARLHRASAGWTAWILSPDMRLPGAMRLKESRRVPMWNGPIECRLFRFDLVAGSARAKARFESRRRR